MKRFLLTLAFLIFYAVSGNCVETIESPLFGKVLVYRPGTRPKHVILFISGDGGWNKRTDERARTMTTLDALVVGIDAAFYVSHMKPTDQDCYYPAPDFLELTKLVEKHMHVRTYISPIVLGYSLGATFVYGMMIQTPPHTFAGAISMGFCPELPLPKPMCKGEGLEFEPYETEKEKGFRLKPSSLLQDPWLIFQGEADAVCSAGGIEGFINQVPHAQLVSLANVGHGFRIEKNWFPEFKQAFAAFEK